MWVRTSAQSGRNIYCARVFPVSLFTGRVQSSLWWTVWLLLQQPCHAVGPVPPVQTAIAPRIIQWSLWGIGGANSPPAQMMLPMSNERLFRMQKGRLWLHTPRLPAVDAKSSWWLSATVL